MIFKIRIWNPPTKELDGHMDYNPKIGIYTVTAMHERDRDIIKQKIIDVLSISINDFFAKEKYVMLFTGIKDKNGKEIWQGDICKFSEDFGNGPIEWNAEIAYVGSSFSAVNRNCCDTCSKLKGCIGSLDELMHHNPIVIGNIFANPELTEKKE